MLRSAILTKNIPKFIKFYTFPLYNKIFERKTHLAFRRAFKTQQRANIISSIIIFNCYFFRNQILKFRIRFKKKWVYLPCKNWAVASAAELTSTGRCLDSHPESEISIDRTVSA